MKASKRVLQGELDEIFNSCLPESIISQCKWPRAIKKRKECRVRSRIFRPVGQVLSIRVEVIDEIDQIINHKPTRGEEIRKIGSMVLVDTVIS